MPSSSSYSSSDDDERLERNGIWNVLAKNVSIVKVFFAETFQISFRSPASARSSQARFNVDRCEGEWPRVSVSGWTHTHSHSNTNTNIFTCIHIDTRTQTQTRSNKQTLKRTRPVKQSNNVEVHHQWRRLCVLEESSLQGTSNAARRVPGGQGSTQAVDKR